MGHSRPHTNEKLLDFFNVPKLHLTHRWKRLLAISVSTCSIVAFETGCWGGKPSLGVYPKIILPRVRVSPSPMTVSP